METVFAIAGVLLVIYAVAAEIIQVIRYKDSEVIVDKPGRKLRIILSILGVIFIAFAFISADKKTVSKEKVTATPLPTPVAIVDTSTVWDWNLNMNSANIVPANNAISVVEGALLLSYEVGEGGYVVLTSDIPAGALSEAEGISFRYKGSGAENSIEFKLMLRFPGDTDDTTYGKLVRHSSTTGGEWVQVDLAFADLTCWWPEENCDKYGDLLDPNMVRRMDFVVVNKIDANDVPGKGVIYFTDVFAIMP